MIQTTKRKGGSGVPLLLALTVLQIELLFFIKVHAFFNSFACNVLLLSMLATVNIRESHGEIQSNLHVICNGESC